VLLERAPPLRLRIAESELGPLLAPAVNHRAIGRSLPSLITSNDIYLVYLAMLRHDGCPSPKLAQPSSPRTACSTLPR
jgi:hypothetical protein